MHGNLAWQQDGWAYILTAAHCVFSSATEMPVRLTAETPLQLTFKGWDGGIVASGLGSPMCQERINIPANMGWASTDVALVKLPLPVR
jgi:hypothetical protein